MPDRSGSLRNVAVVGHGDSGKTTFVEQALHRAGVTGRAGSVTEGNTVSDWQPDERESGHSIDATPVHLPWKGVELQLVDCPGYPDFNGAAIAGLWACDTAVVFVNGITGPGVNTRRMWDAATKLGKARAVVISKLDSENADPEATLAAVRKLCGNACVPFVLPDGKGPDFKSVVPCFGGGGGAPLFGDVDEARGALMEAVVEADDSLLERYLGGEEIAPDEMARALTKAMRAGTVVPVLFASALTGVGLPEVLDFLALHTPSSERPTGVVARNEAGDPIDLAQGSGFVATVFKITSDVHVGKEAFLRVLRGTLPADGVVWNSATKSNVKLAHPTRPQGKDLAPVHDVGCGDVFCVAKVDDLHLCATVSAPGEHVVVEAPPFRRSMVQLAVVSKARGDEHKINAAFARMADEDPSFHSERNAETNELVISGRSSLHLDTVLRRVKQRFKLEMETHIPRVPLKETVLGKAEGHHRHKKQTGGRGQFGEVYLRIAPTERGSGFEFHDKTVGGSIPKNFLPAIEKGVRETLEKGVIAGYPVVDVCVEVYDGKSHPVDSSEAAFKMAGSRAFRNAFEAAKPALLEPLMDVEIDVPAKHMGDISGDLNTRRGRITGMDSHDDHVVIRAQIPLSEVQTYSTDLRSMTSGEGAYSLHFSHLDIVPGQVAQKLMAEYAKHRVEED